MDPGVSQVSLLSYLALERKTALRTLRATTAFVAAVAASGVVTATAQTPTPRDPTKPCPGDTRPGCGDNYLQSVPISLSLLQGRNNLQGFSDSVDTRTATVQQNIFSPGGTGVGPREQTTCSGTPYGRTIWYDLVPTVDGDALVQAAASGFNPVISMVRYDVRAAPNFPPIGASECSNRAAGGLEQLTKQNVKRGRGYSIQIGGAAGAGGPVEVDVNFTPHRVRARSRLRIKPTPNGVEIFSLTVRATRRARIEVSCRPSCGRHSKRGRSVRFPRLSGRKIRAGGRVFVRVSTSSTLGSYYAFRITKGSFRDPVSRCLNRGSRTPRRVCG